MVAILVTPPAAEPVTREEAKAHARISGSMEDARVDALIAAARADVENRTGRALVTQGWRIVRDTVPRGGVVRLAPAPVQSVTAVTVYGHHGLSTEVPPEMYDADLAASPARLVFRRGVDWREASETGLEVDIVCGYGGPEAVPSHLKHAILTLVTYWYEAPDRWDQSIIHGPTAGRVEALIAPYRVARI